MPNVSPSPWTLSGSLIVAADGAVVARVCSSYNLSKPRHEPADYHASAPQWTDGAEHNGRLLAAAPTVLAALAELVARCDGAEGVRADGSNIQTMQAHAALAAALPGE